MTLNEYIEREVALVKEARCPNAISVRFVQLHEQTVRNAEEEDNYQVLLSLMRSRWRWYTASREAERQTATRRRKQSK